MTKTHKVSECPHRKNGAFGCTGCMPPMTKELRERFDEQFSNLSLYMRNRIWSWHEQHIIEAERRMKERCLKCIPGDQPSQPHVVDFNSGWNEACDSARTAISSLK